MRLKTLVKQLVGVDELVVQNTEFRQGTLVVQVRPYRRDTKRPRCSICLRRCPGYDKGFGRRGWRAMDFGTVRVRLEAECPRVRCPEHGVRAAAVPWARANARFTRAFEDTVAWLATQCSKQAVTQLMRVGWRTVGRIIERVVGQQSPEERLRGRRLKRIGIDETSYRKGQRYITVVVDHDTGHLLWAAPGQSSATLNQFFDLIGEESCAGIQLVSADGASWIRKAVSERCPTATLCLDPFHVVAWATKALDQVRRTVWKSAKRLGQSAAARGMKGVRFALLKNPENLTKNQRATLSQIEVINKPLYTAYLMKEQLRHVFKLHPRAAMELLDHWIDWVHESSVKAFWKVASTIEERRAEIDAVITFQLSNARVESMNTKIKLISRRAFGFHGPDALISLAMLSLGGLRPELPGRAAT